MVHKEDVKVTKFRTKKGGVEKRGSSQRHTSGEEGRTCVLYDSTYVLDCQY
jgi:hypothetical protein